MTRPRHSNRQPPPGSATTAIGAAGKPGAAGKRRRRRWVLAALVLVVGCLVLSAPYLLGGTQRGKRLLLRLWDDPRVRIDVQQLSFGWWTPMRATGVTLSNDRGELLLEVPHLQTNIPWWRLLVARPAAIQIVVDHPHLPILVHETGMNFDLGARPLKDRADRAGRRSLRSLSVVHVEIQHARLSVAEPGQIAQAVIPDISVRLHLEQDEAGQWLTIDPLQVLDRTPATPGLCRSGIQYIAPVLARAAWVDGQLSLELKHCRLHLDDARQSRVEGELTLHSVSAGPQGPIAVAIRDSLSQLMQSPPVTRLKIADESLVTFRLEDGRVTHDGLAFGLPEVAPDLVLRTSGSVGLDRQLQLMLDVPLPFQLLSQSDLAQAIGNQHLRVPITGTLDDPDFQIRGDGRAASSVLAELLNQFYARSSGDRAGGSPDIDTIESVTGDPAASDGPQAADDLGLDEVLRDVGGLVDQWLESRQQRRSENASNAPRSGAPGEAVGEASPREHRPVRPRLQRLGDRARSLRDRAEGSDQ